MKKLAESIAKKITVKRTATVAVKGTLLLFVALLIGGAISFGTILSPWEGAKYTVTHFIRLTSLMHRYIYVVLAVIGLGLIAERLEKI